MDVFSLVGAGSTLALVGLCYSMVKDRTDKYVSRERCDLSHKQSAIDIDNAKILADNKFLTLKEDIIEIKANQKEMMLDIKDILKNGRK